MEFRIAFISFASIWVPIAVSLVVLMPFVLRIASKAAATSLLMLVLLVPTGMILISAWIVWLLLLSFNISIITFYKITFWGFLRIQENYTVLTNTDAAAKSCSVACHVYYKLKDGEVFPKEYKAKYV